MKVERPFFLQGLLCVSRVTIFHAKGIRNRRRVFRLPRQFNKNASVPRFVNPKIISVRIKLRGKSKEGGRSPLLGRFKGDCQGGESKLPLDYSFFRPSTALSFSYEKESGVETFAFLARQKRMGRRRQLAPSAHPKWAYGAGKNGPPAQKSMYSACKIKKPSQDKPTTVGRG